MRFILPFDASGPFKIHQRGSTRLLDFFPDAERADFDEVVLVNHLTGLTYCHQVMAEEGRRCTMLSHFEPK